MHQVINNKGNWPGKFCSNYFGLNLEKFTRAGCCTCDLGTNLPVLYYLSYLALMLAVSLFCQNVPGFPDRRHSICNCRLCPGMHYGKWRLVSMLDRDQYQQNLGSTNNMLVIIVNHSTCTNLKYSHGWHWHHQLKAKCCFFNDLLPDRTRPYH